MFFKLPFTISFSVFIFLYIDIYVFIIPRIGYEIIAQSS